MLQVLVHARRAPGRVADVAQAVRSAWWSHGVGRRGPRPSRASQLGAHEGRRMRSPHVERVRSRRRPSPRCGLFSPRSTRPCLEAVLDEVVRVRVDDAGRMPSRSSTGRRSLHRPVERRLGLASDSSGRPQNSVPMTRHLQLRRRVSITRSQLRTAASPARVRSARPMRWTGSSGADGRRRRRRHALPQRSRPARRPPSGAGKNGVRSGVRGQLHVLEAEAVRPRRGNVEQRVDGGAAASGPGRSSPSRPPRACHGQ